MQAVIDGTPLVSHLRDFDYAAHGNDDDTKQAAATMATHGRDLLAAMTEKMGIRVEVISSKALAVENYKIQIPTGRNSYTQQDRYRKHRVGEQGARGIAGDGFRHREDPEGRPNPH